MVFQIQIDFSLKKENHLALEDKIWNELNVNDGLLSSLCHFTELC